MNTLSKYGDLFQIIGVIGIISSLIFVGLELRQTQKIAIAGQQQARTILRTKQLLSAYDFTPEEEDKIPQVASSLDEALEALDKDREFLTKGGVFTDDFIDSFISLKMDEVTRMRMTPHPIEFEMYYSV